MSVSCIKHKKHFCGPLTDGEKERLVVDGPGSAGLMAGETESVGREGPTS